MKSMSRMRKAVKTYQQGGSYAWLVWGLTVIFTIWLYVLQTGYAIYSPALQQGMGLRISQVGFCASIYPFTSAIIQLFSGAMMDRMGPRKTIVPSAFCATIGIILFANAASFWQLVAAQALMAVGASFGFVGAGYISSVWFPPVHFGLMFGLVQVFVSFSSAFGQKAVDWIMKLLDWRELLSSLSVWGVAISICLFIFMRMPKPMPKQDIQLLSLSCKILKDAAYVLCHRDVVLSCICGGIIYGYVWALGVTWLPKIVSSHGVAMNVSNIACSAMWLGVALGSLVIDRIWYIVGSGRNVLLVGLIFQAITLGMIYFLSLSPVLYIVIACLFGMSNSVHMIIYTIGKQTVELQYAGTVLSLINSIMFFMCGLFTAFLGVLLEGSAQQLSDYQHGSWPFWVTMAIATGLVMLYGRKDYRERSDCSVMMVE